MAMRSARAFPVVICFACAVVCLAAAAAHAKFATQEYELGSDAIPAGAKVHPVNVMGDARKEFVVVNQGEAAIYGFGPKGIELKQKFPIPTSKVKDAKTYYGFARLARGAPYSIVLLAPEGAYYFPLEGERVSATPQLLFKKSLIQGQRTGQTVDYLEFALDMDGDGLDELLVPEENSFSIYRQVSPGQFEAMELPRNPYKDKKLFQFQQALPDDPVRIPSISGLLSRRRGVSDLLLFDANGDKLVDLIYTSILPGPNSQQLERYEVFLQRKGGVFASEPSQVMDIPYEGNVDMTFRDLNKDGFLDVLAIRSNYDLVNPRTVVKIYMSNGKPQQLFSKETDRFITKDPIGLVRIGDFNGDSWIDFATTFFSYQFGSADDIVDLALASKVKFKLQFFLGQKDKGFDRQPAFEKELVLNMKSENYRGYPPVLIVDDMNGDHVMDMIARPNEDIVDIYPSEGKLSYPKNPAEEYSVPPDAVLDVEDINGDGLADLLVSSASKRMLKIYISLPKK